MAMQDHPPRSPSESTVSSDTTWAENTTPGLQPDHVYNSSMAWWRAALRRVLVKNLHTESRWLAAMQSRVRTPWLDAFFVYTSSLGTHTFFMIVLPGFFFFGSETAGRGLIQVLAAGVYLSSLIKDLICSPRPFAPPVTRLTMGSHHLEYGFPSTHSTNSVSVALYLYTLIQQHASSSVDGISPISPLVLAASQVALGFYVFSIVFGRLYCGMHSFTDCIVGVILGTLIWAVQWAWGTIFEQWMMTKGWTVPLTIIPIGLFLVNQHAEPIDDCPCFEDAIAFISVVMGSTLAKWHASNWGYDESSHFFLSRTPGSERETWSDWTIWTSFACLKMFVGVAIIVLWRMVAKAVLRVTLPPIIRMASQVATLPNRRFYTPATEYKTVETTPGLHPVPSVIDLPSLLQVDGNIDMQLPQTQIYRRNNRSGKVEFTTTSEKSPYHIDNEKEEDHTKVKHYDAEVLTKVIVYCGIGWFAGEGIPVLFETLKWGVLSGPV